MSQLSACSKVVTMHSCDSRQAIHSYTPHRGIVNSLTINHNNKVVATCGQDGKVFLVNADKPDHRLMDYAFSPNSRDKLPSLTSAAFSHNSKFIAVGAVDSTLKVWDLKASKDKDNCTTIKSHLGGVTSLAWLKNIRNQPDTLVSSSSSGDIYLHSLKNTANPTLSLRLSEGINCVRTSESPEYCRLAACTNAGSLAIWDLLASQQKPFWTTSSQNETKASLTSLAFSSFSPVLLVTASVDENLVFYDIRERKSVKVIPTPEPLNAVGLHGNGHILATGGMYGSLLLYDLRSPSKPQNKLIGHETGIKHLQFFKSREKQNNVEPRVQGNVNIQTRVGNRSNSIIAPQGKQEKKESPQPPKPITNNFVAAPLQSRTMREDMNTQQRFSRQEIPQRRIEDRLSSTGQQLIEKHSQIKPPEPPFRPTSVIESNGTANNIIRKTSDVDIIYLKKQVTQLGQGVASIQEQQKQLKEELYNMQDRLSLSIVKQFQLQQEEFKRMLEDMARREREKDKRILQLEDENKRLKNTTF